MSEDEQEAQDEAAWLLARERGQPVPTVSAATAARYARLQGLISGMPATPAGVALRAGWQQEVLAAIDAAEEGPAAPDNPLPVASPGTTTPDRAASRRGTRPRRWVAVTVICGVAAAAAILLVVYRSRGEASVPTIAFEIEPAARLHRGSDPSVGDTLIVRGVVDGPGELRIYDADGGERARCSVPAPGCAIDRAGPRTTLRITMRLQVAGPLHAILFAAPLAASSGGIDADVEAARHAGIAVTPLEPPVDVR